MSFWINSNLIFSNLHSNNSFTSFVLFIYLILQIFWYYLFILKKHFFSCIIFSLLKGEGKETVRFETFNLALSILKPGEQLDIVTPNR